MQRKGGFHYVTVASSRQTWLHSHGPMMLLTQLTCDAIAIAGLCAKKAKKKKSRIDGFSLFKAISLLRGVRLKQILLKVFRRPEDTQNA